MPISGDGSGESLRRNGASPSNHRKWEFMPVGGHMTNESGLVDKTLPDSALDENPEAPKLRLLDGFRAVVDQQTRRHRPSRSIWSRTACIAAR